MSVPDQRHLTFAILDQRRGIELPPAADQEFPLPEWYRSVHEIPLSDFGLEGIAKSCRQNIYVKHVVPIALDLLREYPLAGEIYDGELLASMKSVKIDYWKEHDSERFVLHGICHPLRERSDVPDDVLQDISSIMRIYCQIDDL